MSEAARIRCLLVEDDEDDYLLLDDLLSDSKLFSMDLTWVRSFDEARARLASDSLAPRPAWPSFAHPFATAVRCR